MRINEITFMSANDDEELPDILYHGTTLELAETILRSGLDPSKTNDRGDHNKGFVFLSWSKDGARKFAPGGPNNSSKELGAILAIYLDSHLAGQMRTDMGEFIRCPVKIPAENIKIVEITNKTI